MTKLPEHRFLKWPVPCWGLSLLKLTLFMHILYCHWRSGVQHANCVTLKTHSFTRAFVKQLWKSTYDLVISALLSTRNGATRRVFVKFHIRRLFTNLSKALLFCKSGTKIRYRKWRPSTYILPWLVRVRRVVCNVRAEAVKSLMIWT